MSLDTDTAHLFSQQLLSVLQAHPAGLSEYELMQTLESCGQSVFSSDRLRDTLSLFQTHFFLFHTLYHLREHLWQSQKARLDISPLCIQLLPIRANAETTLAAHDPLRDYYLDINNLKDTDRSDVDALLGQFWRRFVRDDDRQAALAALDLADPVEWSAIKEQHRRLAMKHHPDRGGDEERLQAINAAMDVLARDSRSR